MGFRFRRTVIVIISLSNSIDIHLSLILLHNRCYCRYCWRFIIQVIELPKSSWNRSHTIWVAHLFMTNGNYHFFHNTFQSPTYYKCIKQNKTSTWYLHASFNIQLDWFILQLCQFHYGIFWKTKIWLFMFSPENMHNAMRRNGIKMIPPTSLYPLLYVYRLLNSHLGKTSFQRTKFRRTKQPRPSDPMYSHISHLTQDQVTACFSVALKQPTGPMLPYRQFE